MAAKPDSPEEADGALPGQSDKDTDLDDLLASKDESENSIPGNVVPVWPE